MIVIAKNQPLYDYIKRQVFEQTVKGFKKFAKDNYDELELAWDDFACRMRLVYKKEFFIPQQIKRKQDSEKAEDELAKKYLLGKKI